MITTKDAKIKEAKPEKLTIIQTGNVKPKQFIIKGKGKPRDKRIITTGNVDKFNKKR